MAADWHRNEAELKNVIAQGGLNSACTRVRERAAAAFIKLGLPDSTNELWRHTKPEAFDFGSWRDASGVEFTLHDQDGKGISSSAALQLRALDDSDQLRLEETFGPLADDLTKDGVAQLQLAAARSWGVLQISRGSVLTEPVYIRQKVVDPNAPAATPILLVVVESGAQLTLVDDAQLDWKGFYAPRIEVLLRPGAQLDLISLPQLHNAGRSLRRIRFHLFRDSVLKYFQLETKGETNRVDLECRLREPGASADLFSLSVSSGSQHADLHPIQEHLAPHCRSKCYAKSVLFGESRSVYYGVIRVAEAAQKTDAYQTVRALLLSEHARADSIPNLEIRANDVKCSHGATVSQVSAEELFYLRSRGIERKEAEKLWVEGFFEDVLTSVRNEALRARIRESVCATLAGQ